MPKVIEKSSGKVFDYDSEFAQELVSGGGFEFEDGAKLNVKSSVGTDVTVSARDLPAVERAGSRLETGLETLATAEEESLQDHHGGLIDQGLTAVEHVADTATMGGFGLAASVLDPAYNRNRGKRTRANPGTAMGADVVTMLAGGLASAGKGALGQVSRATPLTKTMLAADRFAEGGGMARKALAYGAEGAILGAGETVQQLTIDESPITWERATASLKSNVLLGAATGGGIGLAGSALSTGLKKAKGALDDAAKSKSIGGVADDLASLDKEGLRTVQRSAKTELGEEVVEASRAINSDGSLFRITTAGDKKVLTDGRKWLRNHLDDPRGLADNPNLVAKSLRKEEEIIRETIDQGEAVSVRLAKHEEDLLKRLDNQITNYKKPTKFKGDDATLYGDLSSRSIDKKGVKLDKAELEEFRALIKSGAARKLRQEAIEKLPKQLDQNLALQGKIAAIKDGTAPRLKEIRGAFDALSAPKPKAGMVEQAVQGSLFGMASGALSPIAGPMSPLFAGKIATKITDLVFNRAAKAGSDSAIRSAKALSAFLSTGNRLAPSATPLATKILSSVAFGPEPRKLANQLANRGASKSGMATAFMARAQELRSLTEQTPEGTRMRFNEREKIADQLAGIRAQSPKAADMVETTFARRVEFLASKLPRRPDLPVLQMGPDRWQPSEMAMRQFARYVAAVEDPGAVEERLADGTVTPEDAEAVRTVYPEMYNDIKMRIMMALPELRESLPYERRLALSIFSGVPVDEAMHPQILRVLQSNFEQEPGTEGGTQAPTPQPQFGSISKEEPTAAQERAS